MRREELYKHEQTKCVCNCKHNATIDLFYRVKLTKDKTYLDIEDKSKSFIRQLAGYIHSIFRFSTSGLTVRKTDGSTVTIPLLPTTTSSSDTRSFVNHTILVSNNSNDRFLTFDDFNITHLSNSTRVSGYPQLSHSLFADRYEGTVQDAWLYSGSDTQIHAVGLRITNSLWNGTSIGDLLIAKDVFHPPLQLLSNSRIDLTYKIVISL